MKNKKTGLSRKNTWQTCFHYV